MAINGLTSGTAAGITATYESCTVTAEITKTVMTGEDAVIYTKSKDSAAAAAGKDKTNNGNAYGKDKVNNGNAYGKDKDTEAATKAHQSKIDFKTLDQLKAEADEKTAALRNLVEKILLKQGDTVKIGDGLASVFRKLEVDEATRAQAQKDIAEDGYWGIEQTSDRIVSFAKALAADDSKIASAMMDAIKEGFKQAGIEWGEDLPEICKKTMDAVFDKMKDWMSTLPDDADLPGAAQAYVTTTEIKISATYTKAQAGGYVASNTSVKE